MISKMKYFMIGLFACAVCNLTAQSAYYDALALKDLGFVKVSGKIVFETEDSMALVRILKKYVPEGKDTLYAQLQAEFETNPFIKVPKVKSQSTAGSFSIKGIASKGLNAVGGLDVTNFADGLAKFLVKRVKQELTVAFFQRFKNDLDSIKELKILFPQTHKTLMLIDKDVFQFSAYLNTLRESFARDLSNEFENVQKLLKLPFYDNYFFNERPEFGTVLKTSLYVVNQLGSGKHPGDVLAAYNPDGMIDLCRRDKCIDNLKKSQTLNLRGSVKMTQLVSSSFRSRSPDDYWVSSDSVSMLVADPGSFQIYLGLMYQLVKIKEVSFDGFTMQQALDALGKKYESATAEIGEYKKLLTDLSARLQEVNDFMKEVKVKDKTERPVDEYYRVVSSTINLWETAGSFIELPFLPITSDVKEQVKLVFIRVSFISQSISDLYVDVKTKQYASAVMNTVILLDSLTQINNENLSKIMKYGTFMAAVAEAKSSDEVEAAIEAMALPPGSYRVKREAAGNTSINGYVGPFGGLEQITKADKVPAFSYGITAPVGICFSAINSTSKKRGSSSLFISVLDIGAVTAFRFQNDSVSQVPTIQLKNIFSPGIFYSWGIPCAPLSLNIGAQIGPNLRTVSSTVNNYTGNLYVRYSVSLVVDIPLLNIRTRPLIKD